MISLETGYPGSGGMAKLDHRESLTRAWP